VTYRCLHLAYPARPGCAAAHDPAAATCTEPQPFERWAAFLEHVVTEHLPHLGRAQALRQVGATMVDAYRAGPFGPMLDGMLDQGPERVVIRSVALSEKIFTFGRYQVRPLGLGRLEYE